MVCEPGWCGSCTSLSFVVAQSSSSGSAQSVSMLIFTVEKLLILNETNTLVSVSKYFRHVIPYVPCLQVHLEIAPDSQNLSLEGFNELKVSNALRYEVLTEILTSLGLSCEQNQTPAPSPVHLLATSQVKTPLISQYTVHNSHNKTVTNIMLVCMMLVTVLSAVMILALVM